MHPDFDKSGYFIAREFFDNTTTTLMQTYFDFKYRIINYNQEERDKAFKSTILKDNDVADSYNFYSDHLIESIALNYGQSVCSMLSANLSPTYTFARIYEKGSQLMPHVDRPSCEVSATCPIIISDDKPSTIYISAFTVQDVPQGKYTLEEIKTKGDYTAVDLYPGDALFYKGCERFHWREPLESEWLVQFFMHFVQTDGKYKDYYFDERPYMGFPAKYSKNK